MAGIVYAGQSNSGLGLECTRSKAANQFDHKQDRHHRGCLGVRRCIVCNYCLQAMIWTGNTGCSYVVPAGGRSSVVCPLPSLEEGRRWCIWGMRQPGSWPGASSEPSPDQQLDTSTGCILKAKANLGANTYKAKRSTTPSLRTRYMHLNSCVGERFAARRRTLQATRASVRVVIALD